MYRSILVAVDGSTPSENALDRAIALAKPAGSDLSIVHVHLHGRPVEEFDRIKQMERLVDHASRQLTAIEGFGNQDNLSHVLKTDEGDCQAFSVLGDLIVDSAKERAAKSDLEHVQTHIRCSDSADGILDVADEVQADLIVIGHRGLGRVGQIVLGSVSNKVIQNAKCDVLVVR